MLDDGLRLVRRGRTGLTVALERVAAAARRVPWWVWAGGALAGGVALARGAGPKNLPPAGVVKHIVCLLQENHTYDNFFGTYPGGNGFPGGIPPTQPRSTTDPSQGSVTGQANTTALMPTSPSHTEIAAWTCYDNGRMDGFAANDPRNPNVPVDYYDETIIPTYWALAQQYTLHDAFHHSYMGPSLPNHLYWISGTNGYGVPGFNYPPVYANQGDRAGGTTKYQLPLLTWPTVFDQLTGAGVSWHFYGDLRVWSPLAYFEGYRGNPAALALVQSPAEQFASDVAAGNFPEVTYITPSFANSDHPGQGTEAEGAFGQYPANDLLNGQTWVQRTIQAVVDAGFWEDTMFLLSWDEWGGYYDHVRPTFRDSQGPGFRVPLLVVSPWSKANTIVHTPAEFSSIPKLIEDLYGLPYLTNRIATAGDLWEAFDWEQLPNPSPVWPSLAAIP